MENKIIYMGRAKADRNFKKNSTIQRVKSSHDSRLFSSFAKEIEELDEDMDVPWVENTNEKIRLAIIRNDEFYD